MTQSAETTSPEDVPGPRDASDLRGPELASLPSDRLLEELLTRLRRLLGADSATVLILDEDADVLRPVLSEGVTLDRLVGFEVPVGKGFAGRIAATREPLYVADLGEMRDLVGAAFPEAGIRALLGVPLVVEGRVLGVIHVGSRSPGGFAPGAERLLEQAADRAAWAIDHGLLLAAERRARILAEGTAARLHRLQAMSVELLGGLDEQGVVDTVVGSGLSLLGAIAGGVWRLTGDTLELRGVVGYPEDVVERWQRLPLDAEAPAAEAARLRQPVVIRSPAERDVRYPSLAGKTTVGLVFVTLPLVVDDAVIGVLGLGFDRLDALEDDGMAFLNAAAAQCTSALHRGLVLDEREQSLRTARRVAARLAALQRVTAVLADAREPEQVLDLVASEAAGALDAVRAMLVVLDESGERLRPVRAHGVEAEVAARFAAFPVDAPLPAAEAVRTGAPVVVRSIAERDARYPQLAGVAPVEDHTMVCLPLCVAEQRLGALALTFPSDVAVDDEDLPFLTALADQCAHALERSRLLRAEARTRRRLEMLAEAGRAFSAPVDVRLTSAQFCRIVLAALGDSVTVALREAHGRWAVAAHEERTPARRRDVRDRRPALPAHLVADYEDVLVSGVPQLTRRDGAATDVRLPLVANGRALGVVSVTTSETAARPLGDDDVDLLGELAARLALALDSARLLRQQMDIAHTLQRSLLPASLPQVPGAEVAVRYLPGAEGVEVGGDFYDVIPLPSGRIGLVVGDVMGRGVRAAAVMGQLRAAVRGYSLEGHGPAALLTRLDRLVGTLEEGLLVTALYAEWDPARHVALTACAGHLPPLVRLPGAAPAFLELDPGVPLGVGLGGYTEREVELAPGALLLAFTDGLVEGPDLPVEVGMRRLAEAVAGAGSALDVCEAALAALRPRAGDGRRYDDDTALFAIVTHDTAPTPVAATDGPEREVELELPAERMSPAHARHMTATILERWGLGRLADSATLLVSELVTNAVRHAGTAVRVTLTRLALDRVRIAITDHAPDVPVRVRSVDDDAEGGRGLFLVEHLATGWGSVADDTAKTVWFELRG